MRPLQWIGMGYVLIALYARQGGWDLLPDPLGWLLVLLVVGQLPASVPRGTVRAAVALALVVSAVLFVPDVLQAVGEEDDALVWATELPALLCTALLAHHLARAARLAGDRSATRSWRALAVVAVVVAVLPVLVLGAGWDALAPAADSLAQLLNLGMVAGAFFYSGRAWAVTEPAERPTPGAVGS